MIGRRLGLDPGEARIGVALSDPLGIIASPHDVIDRRREDVMVRLRDIIESNEVATVVIGLPTSLDGREGPAAQKARALGDRIIETLKIDVEYYDERFTTVQAESALLEGNVRRDRRREVVDKVAAALMLQGHLDHLDRSRPGSSGDVADDADED